MALIQLIGGLFQDSFQNPVANGTLVLELVNNNPDADGYLYEIITPFDSVCLGTKYSIPLDEHGNILLSPAHHVYSNDSLFPTDSYYRVTCYTENGERVWGPNSQNVLSSLSPLSTTFDVGMWIPNELD